MSTGLDREAIERRAERAVASLAAETTMTPGRYVRYYAADVPALLAALRAAEAEVKRWKAVYHGHVLRTEGGAS